MTQQEIEELARHRKVPSWVIKLVADAIAAEREACAYRASIALLGADRGLANRVDKAIRARGNVREHTMSGDCWCNPELNYTDPETGAEVWVHKEPQ